MSFLEHNLSTAAPPFTTTFSICTEAALFFFDTLLDFTFFWGEGEGDLVLDFLPLPLLVFLTGEGEGEGDLAFLVAALPLLPPFLGGGEGEGEGDLVLPLLAGALDLPFLGSGEADF